MQTTKMVSNREKIQLLEFERQLKLDAIYAEYAPKIKALLHDFTIKELELLGWRKVGIYMPSGGDEWIFEKNSREIRVGVDEHYVMTSSGTRFRRICDTEDLDYYEKNNK